MSCVSIMQFRKRVLFLTADTKPEYVTQAASSVGIIGRGNIKYLQIHRSATHTYHQYRYRYCHVRAALVQYSIVKGEHSKPEAERQNFGCKRFLTDYVS